MCKNQLLNMVLGTKLEEAFDKADAEQMVSSISFPRLTGSEGSKKAVDIILNKFDKIGIPLTKEPFQATKFWTGTVTQGATFLAFILTCIMFTLSFIAPAWNLLVIGSVLAIALWGIAKWGGSELGLHGTPLNTENLLAKISPSKERKGIILIMGHHDSKSQVLTTVQRSAFFTFGGFAILLSVLIFFIQSMIVVFGHPIPSWLTVFGFITVAMVVLCTVPLSVNFTRNKSPGALDNASSVAVQYMLGKYFKTHPLVHHEIWILSTGAEELGMLGALAFVKAHKSELDPKTTFCLNFDMVGRKGCTVEVMEKAGFPKAKPVCAKLNEMAKIITQEYGYDFTCFYLPTGAATDRFVIAKLGIQAMDFVNKKAAFETHTVHDDVDRFDPALAK